jgi:molecular chaperone GrpE
VAEIEKELNEETPVEEVAEEVIETPEVNPWEEKYNAERDAHLRVAAEFDNFRKRTIKEKEASYGNGKADAVAKMLPIYDNLERALQQETTDAAFKKGVEMT